MRVKTIPPPPPPKKRSNFSVTTRPLSSNGQKLHWQATIRLKLNPLSLAVGGLKKKKKKKGGGGGGGGGGHLKDFALKMNALLYVDLTKTAFFSQCTQWPGARGVLALSKARQERGRHRAVCPGELWRLNTWHALRHWPNPVSKLDIKTAEDYSRLKGGNYWQLKILSSGDLNSCFRRTPLRDV